MSCTWWFASPPASSAVSTSLRTERQNETKRAFVRCCAISRVAANSLGEEAGKAGFDAVDAERFEAQRDGQLLLGQHGVAGCLFAVTQRRVEDRDAALRGASLFHGSLSAVES